MGRLAGRVALITGGARGQGEAEARLFHREGAAVMITDVLEDAGRALAKDLGERAAFQRLDVSSESEWETVVAATVARFGKLDTLINNAGILKLIPLFETSLDDYMAIVRINQVGCFLGVKIGGRAIAAAGGGSIVNVSSVAGLWGTPGGVAYGASKFAVTGMTRTAALELGRLGIRVNAIHPGTIDTPMIRALGSPEMLEASGAACPVGRIGKPEDIAQLALFLASHESGFCTGASFVADGGVMAGDLSMMPMLQG